MYKGKDPIVCNLDSVYDNDVTCKYLDVRILRDQNLDIFFFLKSDFFFLINEEQLN